MDDNSFDTFADIVPLFESVEIRGTSLKVRGIGIYELGEIIAASGPAVLNVFAGSIDATALCIQAPDVAFAIVAAGLRKPVTDDRLKASFRDNLNLTDQADLVLAVIKATMPRGTDPFVKMGQLLGLKAIPTATDAPLAAP